MNRIKSLIVTIVSVGVACALLIVVHQSRRVTTHVPLQFAQTPLPAATLRLKKIQSNPKLQVVLTRDFAVPVLMYHRISDLTPKEAASPLMRDLTVSVTNFDLQVKYLIDNGFSCLLASEVEEAIRAGRTLPEKAVCITMDDGYRDNFDNAYPILQKYRVPATIFLVTSTVNTDGHLSWQNVREMLPHPVNYGSHSVTHRDLTTLSTNELNYELKGSKLELQSRLQGPINDLAYPSGAYNETVTHQAKLVGYLAGWKKGGGPAQPGTDPLLLPRIRVNGGSTMEDFKRKVWSGINTIRYRSTYKPAVL